MPELPEVETVVRELKKALKGRVLRRVKVNFGKIVGRLGPAKFARQLAGQKVADVKRRGKLIIILLDSDRVLLVHLKMTGQLVFNQPAHKHTHVVFELDNGQTLNYNDIRKFGFLELTDADGLRQTVESRFAFGPEPLSKNFTADYLLGQLAGKKAPVKSLLLDQTIVAGLGNIYVDESLYMARIHPGRQGQSLNKKEVAVLYRAIVAVLTEAVKRGGSSSQNYVRTSGERGTYSELHKVYRKTGSQCGRCGSKISRTVIAGRGTHFCPKCQK